MRRTYGIATVASLGLASVMWVGISRAQQQEGVAARAAEKLDEVGRKIKKGFEKAEDAVREGFHKTRDSVHGMGVMSPRLRSTPLGQGAAFEHIDLKSRRRCGHAPRRRSEQDRQDQSRDSDGGNGRCHEGDR